MRIIRVFPRQTSMTPRDELAFVGDPPLMFFRPHPDQVDEVHVSVAFTWDIPEAQRLAASWSQYYDVVRIGGPALSSPCDSFEPGVYIQHGVTFTTRGCNCRCPWCLVGTHEGYFMEIQHFAPGYIIQDNNILQASHDHLDRVFNMLRQQRKGATFSGGLQASLVNDWVVEELRSLRIAQIFLAADTKEALRPLEDALKKLAALGRQKLRVYTMLAYNGETISDAEERLEKVWELGGMPFAQLYQPPDQFIKYSKQWKQIARKWSRPAAMRTAHAGA